MILKRIKDKWDKWSRQDWNDNMTIIEKNFNNVVDVVSNQAYNQVVESATLIWKEPVNTFSNLANTYPNAEAGWTVMVREVVTGFDGKGVNKVYRYNGSEWTEIQQILADAVNEVDHRLTSQLAQTEQRKADRTYVDGLISGISDASPRDVFHSISALETAFPNGELGTYLVFDSSFTDGAHSFIWSKSENVWKDLGLYQGNGIADNIITPIKLSPNLRNDEVVNLYNKNATINNGYYDLNGNWVVAQDSYASSDKIPCVAGDVFGRTLKLNGVDTNFFNLVTFWDSNENFVTSLDIQNVIQFFNVPDNPIIAYMCGSIPLPFKNAELMLVKGNTYPKRYYAYGESAIFVANESIKNDSLSFDKIKNVQTQPINLFNKFDLLTGGYFNLQGNWVANKTYCSSNKITCVVGEQFTRTVENNNQVGNQFTFWDANDNFLEGRDFDVSIKTITIPNNSNIAYMRISCVLNRTELGMVVKGNQLPDRYYSYDDNLLLVDNINIKDRSITKNKLSFEPFEVRVDKKTVNLFDKNAVLSGGYYDLHGVWIENTSYLSSGKIECSANDIFTRTTHINGERAYFYNNVTYWDADDNFVESIDIGTSQAQMITVPNDSRIAYMRGTVPITVLNAGVMIVKGVRYPSRYYSYGEEVVEFDTENIKDMSITKDKLAFKLGKHDYGEMGIVAFEGVANPILTKEIVTDRVGVTGVADPFIAQDADKYHAFFEVLGGTNPRTNTKHDEIGHAYSYDLKKWTYTQIVYGYELNGHRAAYPKVFEWQGDWYMIPDISADIKVYKANNFPFDWVYVTTLLAGSYVDTEVFEKDNVWYMATSRGGEYLEFYYNTSGTWLNDQWTEHPSSPIFSPGENGEYYKRCGGRVDYKDGCLYLPIQGMPTGGIYGQYLDLYKIADLTPTTVNFVKMGRLLDRQLDGSWAHSSMHHICSVPYLNKNAYLVDGLYLGDSYAIGLAMDS